MIKKESKILWIVSCLTVLLLVGGFVYYTVFSDDGIFWQKPEPHLENFSDLVMEENGKSIFAISVADFINCFNGVYRQRHKTDYLSSPNTKNWHTYTERSILLGYDSVRYIFSADPKVWVMPNVSFYTMNKDEIYEFRMVFDNHGYREHLREEYKELCICMEKMMMPELSETEAEHVFEKLFEQSPENFFGDHAAFGDPERPKLNAVYLYGKIGMYSFYGSGNIEICFVPLTANAMNILQNEEISILNWKKLIEE